MTSEWRNKIQWLDVVWLLFLAGLAILPPEREIHKQLTLVAFGAVQLSERWIIARDPDQGRHFVVLVKLLLATLLIAHTGGPEINSSYYPVYYVPVVTAALYFGPRATLLYTAVASAMYCSFLLPALEEYELTPEGIGELSIRVMFFFVAGLIVNRFSTENRRQTEELAETNQQLQLAQEEARRSERLAALGQLSAGLAHEIRNPLGVIKGSAEMLNQKLHDSNPLASELAGYISSEVNRVSMLVSRFLDFARPLHPDTKAQPLTDLLDHAQKIVAEHWRGGAVKVEKAYDKNLPLVEVDSDLFIQAFVNLIQNAYDAMDGDGGTLRLQAARKGGPGAFVEVRVQDSGPGIAPELQDQIFNPFVTTKKAGVGLGLSIVSKIVDEHRGTVRIESPGGPGACFVISLPASAVGQQKGTHAPA